MEVQEQQNPSGRGALAQNSIIPLGWKPTPDKPVPVVRCVVIKKDGNRCGGWSLRGHTKCKKHLRGADVNFSNVREHMDAVIEAARMRLVDDADMAIDTLEALLEPGTAEGIRLKAATEILDRVGVRGGFEVEMEVTEKIDAAAIIAERLRQLKERAIPGEVVQDDEELPQIEGPAQETLF